jgi:hypothetical protein
MRFRAQHTSCPYSGSSSWSASLRLPQVSGASRLRYRLGSTTSALTSVLTSSGPYTQPFGSFGLGNAKSLGDDTGKLLPVVVGWRNLSSILVVWSRRSTRQAASVVACARLRLNLATPLAGTGARTGIRGGRSRVGLGMMGVWP